MKKALGIVGVGMAAALVAAAFVFTDIPHKEPDQLYNTPIEINNQKLTVEVANTPEKRQQGLSGRPSLPQDVGMLFVFKEPIIPNFWMKDMNFSIDIIWIDESGSVVGLERDVSPDTFPQTFSPQEQVRYVLEVNAGWAQEHAITIGDRTILQ